MSSSMLTLLIAMFSFSLSMSISPGPVNITILSSSMNYGFKPTFTFISGASIGFTALLAAVCFGLFQFLQLYPILMDFITLAGTALLLWMGWKIISAKSTAIHANPVGDPPSFKHGVLMQWLNPKAWIAAVAGTALFSSSGDPQDLLYFVLIYFIVCYLSLILWGIAGDYFSEYLNKGQRAKILNLMMGTVLIIISLEICWSHFVP